MLPGNLPSNSHRAKNQASGNIPSEGPKLDPVVTGKVVLKKKPLGRRVIDTLFRGDGGVINYLVVEVLVPALQNLLIDTVTQGIQRAVGVDPRQIRSSAVIRGSGANRTHISYDRPGQIISRSPVPQPSLARRPVYQASSSTDLGDIIIETEFEAQMIVEKLYETIQQYDAVTVANLKELLRETAMTTDHKWGWGEDAEFRIRRVREGYRIDYPDPVPIK